MTLYYQGPAARITHEAFESLRPVPRMYVLRELRQVHAVRDGFAAVMSWFAWRRPWELRALYRGRLVCLYSTTDRLVFGQVTRALRRALEGLEDTR